MRPPKFPVDIRSAIFRTWKKRISHMNNKIRGPLLSAAALALIVGAGLSSCSEPAEQATPEQSASEPAAGGEAAVPDGESEKNAKALLKGMSDYLAAQKV